jgi:hypothetical protein
MERVEMNDKQLGVLYAIVLICWVGSFALLHHLLKVPIDTEGYADRICQDLYGPQTGHKWVDDVLMCETARGEVLAIRMK